MRASDYDVFRPFLGKVVAECHGVSDTTTQVNDWSVGSVSEGTVNGCLDVPDHELSTLVTVQLLRNLTGFPLPGLMSGDDRRRLEATMVKVSKTFAERNVC